LIINKGDEDDEVYAGAVHAGVQAGDGTAAFEPGDRPYHGASAGTVRRLIFVKVSATSITKPADVFSFGVTRVPDFMIDVDVHTLGVLAKNLPVETAWGKVPTPAF
jgi:hypothetical protein